MYICVQIYIYIYIKPYRYNRITVNENNELVFDSLVIIPEPES